MSQKQWKIATLSVITDRQKKVKRQMMSIESRHFRRPWVTFNVIHILQPFQMQFLYSYAIADKISTDIARRAASISGVMATSHLHFVDRRTANKCIVRHFLLSKSLMLCCSEREHKHSFFSKHVRVFKFKSGYQQTNDKAGAYVNGCQCHTTPITSNSSYAIQ